MDIIKHHNSSQPDKNLTVDQLNAIDLLIQGKTDQETADVVGVSRETVNRWRNSNPYFQVELNIRREEVWGAAHDRLRNLLSRAVEVLENSLRDQSLKAAVEVLRILAVHGKVEAPQGPKDPETVLWQQAEKWARWVIEKKSPSDPLFTDLFLREKTVKELAKHRMKFLSAEYGLESDADMKTGDDR